MSAQGGFVKLYHGGRFGLCSMYLVLTTIMVGLLQDFPLHKMACDLSIVMGDPVAVLRYVTGLADSLTKSGADAPAEANVIGGATDNAPTELVAAELVALVLVTDASKSDSSMS